jgi:tetratricopeptide (TPR) repeat protein
MSGAREDGAASRQWMPLPRAMALAEEHRRAGRLAAAEDMCRQILRAKPENAEATHLLGLIAHQAGNGAAAIDLLRRAIQLDRNVALYHANLGEICRLAGRLDEAVKAGRRAVQLNSQYPQALSNLGIALYDRGEYAEAVACHERAIAIAPGFAEAHSNLGNALRALRRFDEAIPAYRRALDIKPAYADAWSNLGSTLHLSGRYEEATAAYKRALAIDPAQANAHAGLGMLLLLRGNFADGWAEYEWRWRSSEMKLARLPGLPWQGENLEGRRIHVHSEQGFGDVIQFARYVPMLRERGAEVSLLVQPQLARLVAHSMPWATMVTEREPAGLPPEYHCALLTLPRIFGTRFETIPLQCPYLHAPDESARRWQDRFAGDPALKVGLVWAGNPKQINEVNRGIEIAGLGPLLAIPGVRFFSLQVGPRAGDLKSIPANVVTDLSAELTDFSETAGAMAALDLVISTDTSVPHLAGALGRPVWLLLSRVVDWRWFLEREDSPWYPTMRLFRQDEAGSWEPVVARVAAELSAVASGAREKLTPRQGA